MGTTIDSVTFEARAGGSLGGEMRDPGGSEMLLLGTVVEIEPPSTLVMTNRWVGQELERLVTVELTEAGDRTRLRLTHEHLPEGMLGAFEAGWGSTLARLAALLAG